MSNGQVDLKPAELLKAIYENLNKCFFTAAKYDAKQRYRLLVTGKPFAFMTLATRDQGEIAFELALDQTQHDGSLTFTQFRNALAAHLNRIAAKLAGKQDLNIFTSNDTGDWIFNIPGIVEYADKVNILVTCVEQRAAGQATIRLLYLDPKEVSN